MVNFYVFDYGFVRSSWFMRSLNVFVFKVHIFVLSFGEDENQSGIKNMLMVDSHFCKVRIRKKKN